MKTLISYDITSKHVEFKEEMFRLGYVEMFVNSKKYVYLPNTTLIHSSKNAVQCKDDAKRVSAILGVELERCISTNFGPDWSGIYGEPF
ncbi:hypothetical protein AAGF08_08835 [Algoriphagus sp. SE2]|uniref:hypothetical protein n=1 Tax=Algoriphagus sp. SE2 TaxID=3141536 RepID=UPI0031CD5D8A